MMKQSVNTIIIAVAVIITGFLLANGYKNRSKVADAISVTGSGEENFTSDLIVWRAGFSKKNYDLKTAYSELNKDQQTIRKYLISKGIKADELIFEAVDIQKDFVYDYDQNGQLRNTVFNGYQLTQNLKIQSKNVDGVENISREVTELIDAGVELTSYPPEYYYTKLAQLKLKMIESATTDAKNRAEKIALNAGGSLGKLKTADMGVFQITGENSSEQFSWGGNFNTSSKKKTANITIRLKYEIH
ncbi:SIMPL domain-containing protein [Fluviicola sp.]|uniref:SIMPL domain-containing protein n=1 Tax=Fluviicola sp. TaxID=1917219 RepID=UPI0031D9F4D6